MSETWRLHAQPPSLGSQGWSLSRAARFLDDHSWYDVDPPRWGLAWFGIICVSE